MVAHPGPKTPSCPRTAWIELYILLRARGADAAVKARSVSGSMKLPVAELMGSSRYPVRGSIPDSPGDVMSRSVRHKGVPAARKAARREESGKAITPEPAARKGFGYRVQPLDVSVIEAPLPIQLDE